MSLDWNATKVANLDTLHTQKVEANKTAYLCYNLMFVGVGRITEDNVEDTWKRVSLWERLHGALLSDSEGNPFYYTREDLLARIGYSTNVSTMTSLAFIKKVWSDYKG
jgi:hypothetical protein